MLDRLSMVATAVCRTACPLCSVKEFRQLHRGYHMPLADVEKLIRRCRESDCRYTRISPTGGEPLEWEHFAEASRMLSDAGIADELSLITSLTRPDVLESVIHLYGYIRVSLHPHNKAATVDLYRKYPDRIHVWAELHRRAPSRPVPNSLPAECVCPDTQGMVFGRMYTCNNAYSLALRLGVPVDDPEISCSLDDDFAEHWLSRRQSRFSQRICSGCLANNRVWASRAADVHLSTYVEMPPDVPVHRGRQ
jgi:hypothetical protein